MSRGADLYDLFMAMRYDRAEAAEKGLWKLMCRMAQEWNDEDREAHRQTYFKPGEAVARHLRLHADVLVKRKA